jgi:hypothetical protein
MKRRATPEAPRLPHRLAVFDPQDWPGRPPGEMVGTDRQWRRLAWNRARSRWLRRQQPVEGGR